MLILQRRAGSNVSMRKVIGNMVNIFDLINLI